MVLKWLDNRFGHQKVLQKAPKKKNDKRYQECWNYLTIFDYDAPKEHVCKRCVRKGFIPVTETEKIEAVERKDKMRVKKVEKGQNVAGEVRKKVEEEMGKAR